MSAPPPNHEHTAPPRPGLLRRRDPFVRLGSRHRSGRARTSPWRRPLAIAGLTMLGLWIFAAVFAPLVSPHDPLAQDLPRYSPPGEASLLGTDELGRDLFSRIIHGARITLPLAGALVLIAATIGCLAGGISGYFGGRLDEAVMRVTDLVFAFPTIILAMAVVAALGAGLFNAVIAVAVAAWPSYARVVRSLVLAARQSEYVASARLLGASSIGALFREVVPNIAGPVLVLCTLELGNAVLILSGLSFLGLGAVPPTPEWGVMVSTGARAFDRWWVGAFPGLAILTLVLAFNFIGDALRDAFDPRTARVLKAGQEAATK